MDKIPLWLQVVTAVFTSGLLTAIITGIFNKKRLGADAAKIITDAAASVTSTMSSRLRELEAKEQMREREEDEFRIKLERHEAWDRKLVQKIRQMDSSVELEDPPTLR